MKLEVIMSDNENLINQNEVAEMLNVSPRQVLSLSRKGQIPSIKVGKFVRFRKVSIIKWIKENEKISRLNNFGVNTE